MDRASPGDLDQRTNRRELQNSWVGGDRWGDSNMGRRGSEPGILQISILSSWCDKMCSLSWSEREPCMADVKNNSTSLLSDRSSLVTLSYLEQSVSTHPSAHWHAIRPYADCALHHHNPRYAILLLPPRSSARALQVGAPGPNW
jgi:hypothetical protein